MLDHQVGWCEEGSLKGRLLAVREGYEAQILMATFLWGEKGARCRDIGARQR